MNSASTASKASFEKLIVHLRTKYPNSERRVCSYQRLITVRSGCTYKLGALEVRGERAQDRGSGYTPHPHHQREQACGNLCVLRHATLTARDDQCHTFEEIKESLWSGYLRSL